MANEVEGARTQRRYERVTGPFDGLLDTAVLVYDLNLGGCFINTPHDLEIGASLSLRINLLQEGWISVNAEPLYQHQHGFGARFLDLDSDAAARIARTVAASKGRR